jgi:hypothetical protein
VRTAGRPSPMRAPSPTVERGDPAGIRLTGTLPARIPPRATVHAALTVAMDRCDGAPGLMAPDVDTLRSAVCRACGGLGALVSLVAPGTVGADATHVTSPFPSCWTSRPTGCGRCASSAGPVPGRPGPTWLQPAPGAVDTQRNYAAGDRPSRMCPQSRQASVYRNGAGVPPRDVRCHRNH